ncbi:transmembrane protein 265 [Discoglossus pictus]
MADIEMAEEPTSNKMMNGAGLKEVLISTPQTTDGAPSSSETTSQSRSCISSLSCNTKRLAIMSIVCGLSCVGIKALLLAVEAKQEKEKNPPKYYVLTRRARHMAILSISLWVGILVCLPLLLVLMSYILAQIE